MSNLFDYPKFSTFVGGIVDRKVRALALSITSSTGYLRSLIIQAGSFAQSAQASSSEAQNAAASADADAASTKIIYSQFTSTYFGLQPQDPTHSSIAGPINQGGFYIRTGDLHLRVATILPNGTIVFQDAAVVADPASVIAICNGRYLSLVMTIIQTVLGPVTFEGTTSVPAVTDWGSFEAVPASDVARLINGVQSTVSAETQRAEQAEGALGSYVDQERTRAQNSEQNIAQGLANESSRAQAAEQSNAQSITQETSRAQAAEQSNAQGIASNSSAINSNSHAILDETNRARAAEQANAGTISGETNRAQSVEQALNTLIANEIARATAAENANTTLGNANTTKINNLAGQFITGYNQYGYYEIRPNGIIEQWGTIPGATGETNLTIIFPLQYGDASSVNVMLTPVNSDNSGSYDMWVQRVSTSVSQCVILTQWPAGSGEKKINAVDWRALGYANAQAGDPATQTYNPGSGTTTTANPGSGSQDGGTTYSAGTGSPVVNQCPEVITPILLANENRSGPGGIITAADLLAGDYVWTQHEQTLEWGAYEVTQARLFDDVLWQADGYYKATKGHPFYLNDKWVKIEEIGHESDRGSAVAISVNEAKTFISLDLQGNQVLNHNIKNQQP